VLDERTGLITVEARHHDVDEHDVRRVVGNLRKCIEPIDRRIDLTTLFASRVLGGLPDGLGIVDDEYLQTLEVGAGVVHTQTSPGQTKKPFVTAIKMRCGTASCGAF
jgi:hypothetical protein